MRAEYFLSTSWEHTTQVPCKRLWGVLPLARVRCWRPLITGRQVAAFLLCVLVSVKSQPFTTGVKSQLFTVGVGLSHGCVLFPLIIVYMNWVDSHSQFDDSVTVGSCRINSLRCADNSFSSYTSYPFSTGFQLDFFSCVQWILNGNSHWIFRGIRSLQKPKAVLCCKWAAIHCSVSRIHETWGSIHSWWKAEQGDIYAD